MAKPDTDDGWFKIAIELEAALAFAGFSKVARTLLRYVFTQIYGRGARPKVAYLPQKTIADRIGQQKQNVSRAVRELVESNVLIEVRDDQYRFVKDYETWVTWGRDDQSRGRPRLSPAEVADCKDAPSYANAFRVRSTADPADDCVSSNGITGGNPTGLPAVIQRDYQSNPSGLPESSNGITGAIEDRARVQREIEKERRESPLTPRRGERGREPRPTKGQKYELDRRRQVEAIRVRRAAEAGKEADRG